MEQHIKIVAILHIVVGILFLAGALAIFVFGAGAAFLGAGATDTSEERNAALMGGTCVTVVAVAVALMSLPSIIAGLGLQRRKNWARILTIILSVLNLLNFPLGTALGGYSLWVLLNEQSKSYFS